MLQNSGVNDIIGQSDNLSLYPNPANDAITVSIPTNTKYDFISIFNIQGELIQQQPLLNSTSEINISNLTSGMYVIKATNPETYIVKRFVKE